MSEIKTKEIKKQSNIVELLKELVKANEENFDLVKIESSNIFDYTIVVNGEFWDGEFIDAQNAAYVLDLQKSFQKILKSTGSIYEVNYNNSECLVKVKLKKGSCEYIVQGFELLKPYLDNMESIHLMIAIVAGIASFAGYKITKILTDSHEKILADKNHSSDVSRLSSTIDNALQVIQDANDVNRKLVSRMKDGDTISFDDKKIMSCKNAKQAFPRRSPEKTMKDSADGNYEVMGFDLENNKVQLLQDGNELSADMILTTDDLSKFYDIVKESQMAQEKSLPTVDFKITIEYNSRGIKSALVIGIGTSRENSYRLSHFINR